MANVLNRTTLQYLTSVNTPDYPTEDWVINPNLTPVEGVEQKYWVLTGDVLSEMTQEEKDAVDAAETEALNTLKEASVIFINEASAGQVIGDWPAQDVVFSTSMENSNLMKMEFHNNIELEFKSAGLVHINACVSVEQLTGRGRHVCCIMLMSQLPQGQYEFVNGTKRFLYTRNSSDGAFGSMECSINKNVVEGERVKIAAWRNNGGGTLTTVADATNICAFWMELP